MTRVIVVAGHQCETHSVAHNIINMTAIPAGLGRAAAGSRLGGTAELLARAASRLAC